jgi:DNA repair photolyase
VKDVARPGGVDGVHGVRDETEEPAVAVEKRAAGRAERHPGDARTRRRKALPEIAEKSLEVQVQLVTVSMKGGGIGVGEDRDVAVRDELIDSLARMPAVQDDEPARVPHPARGFELRLHRARVHQHRRRVVERQLPDRLPRQGQVHLVWRLENRPAAVLDEDDARGGDEPGNDIDGARVHVLPVQTVEDEATHVVLAHEGRDRGFSSEPREGDEGGRHRAAARLVDLPCPDLLVGVWKVVQEDAEVPHHQTDSDGVPGFHCASLNQMKRRGRGAQTNRSGRFERHQYVPLEERDRIETVVAPDATRSIIARNDSPDVPFDASINPYRGCEHGCIYCFARPTHAYLGLSPGLDFETRIFSKPRAAELLREELSRPSYRCEVLALGANTDPYQPVERELRITRSILEVLAECNHPVSVVTKSQLVLRDLDLLAPMAAKNLASVFVSITTLDPELAGRMEPRASAPEKRLETLRGLRDAGVPCGVLASPMIPALNDAELEKILKAAAESGAGTANYILLRLPLELKELFAEWLDAHYRAKAKHVEGLIREARGGDLYRSGFGERMRGTGVYAELLEKRFHAAVHRYGLDRTRPALDTSRFRTPRGPGAQMALFD